MITILAAATVSESVAEGLRSELPCTGVSRPSGPKCRQNLRFRRPARGAPKSSAPKVPKKCSPKCFWGPGWECRKKCRKTAENVLEMLKKGLSAVFRHFFRHSQPDPRKHFGEHFFGTFGAELFGAPLAGRRNLKTKSQKGLPRPEPAWEDQRSVQKVPEDPEDPDLLFLAFVDFLAFF